LYLFLLLFSSSTIVFSSSSFMCNEAKACKKHVNTQKGLVAELIVSVCWRIYSSTLCNPQYMCQRLIIHLKYATLLLYVSS